MNRFGGASTRMNEKCSEAFYIPAKNLKDCAVIMNSTTVGWNQIEKVCCVKAYDGWMYIANATDANGAPALNYSYVQYNIPNIEL